MATNLDQLGPWSARPDLTDWEHVGLPWKYVWRTKGESGPPQYFKTTKKSPVTSLHCSTRALLLKRYRSRILHAIVRDVYYQYISFQQTVREPPNRPLHWLSQCQGNEKSPNSALRALHFNRQVRSKIIIETTMADDVAHSCTIFPCYLGMDI